MNNKDILIKSVFESNYVINENYLDNKGITYSDVMRYVEELRKNGNHDEAIQILRKADNIWQDNYKIISELMLSYVDVGDFESAHDEMNRIDSNSNYHEKTTYQIIKLLKTYHNVTTYCKLPNVYSMGTNFRDSYKKWDTINAQMFSCGTPTVHILLAEINRVIIERKIANSKYYDTFDSIVSKLYYEPNTVQTREDLAIYLTDIGKSEYQDFFMWLFMKKDPNIADYLDTVSRNMMINTNELTYELLVYVNNKDIHKARYVKNLLLSLPDNIYDSNKRLLAIYIVNRLEYILTKTEYRGLKTDLMLEQKVLDLINAGQEKELEESDELNANKILYLLDYYHVSYEYEIDKETYKFIINPKVKKDLDDGNVLFNETYDIEDIERMITRVVEKNANYKKVVQKLTKRTKIVACLILARESYKEGKIELGNKILEYANLLITKLDGDCKNIIEFRNYVNEVKVRALT